MQAPFTPPGQVIAFPGPVESSSGPLVVHLAVSLHKVPRRRCASCSSRRICYFIGLGDIITSPPLCARCAGIR